MHLKKLYLLIPILLLLGVLSLSGCTQEESGPAQADSAPAEGGLSEDLKKEVYFELVKYQDGISFDDPDYAQKNQDAYSVLAERYGIEEAEVRSIAVEGSKELWPVPPLPS